MDSWKDEDKKGWKDEDKKGSGWRDDWSRDAENTDTSGNFRYRTSVLEPTGAGKLCFSLPNAGRTAVTPATAATPTRNGRSGRKTTRAKT